VLSDRVIRHGAAKPSAPRVKIQPKVKGSSETSTSLAVNDLNRRAEFDECENSLAVEFFIIVSKIAIVEPSEFDIRIRRRAVWLASHLLAKHGRQIAAHSSGLCWLFYAIERRVPS
jgi:hypothetical protein